MTRPEPGADDTIRLRPAVFAARRQHRGLILAALLVGILSLAGGSLVWWRQAASPPAVPVQVHREPPAVAPPQSASAPQAAPQFRLRTADEAQILAHVGTGLTIFRFAPDPRILVLDFASLRQQGMMLDRVAALTEKHGLPHDRILTDTELEAAIKAGGDTLETYYYGHDYSVRELVHFFALADAEHMKLHPQEQTLRDLMRQQGWFEPDVRAALISIPQAGSDKRVTIQARRTILRHELSHGLFFSDPSYAAFVHGFWHDDLTQEERARFRQFLGSEEYDIGLNDLVINEMQAYLMFTRDPEFFTPAMISMTPARLQQLQTAFAAGMPHGWLRDTLLATITH